MDTDASSSSHKRRQSEPPLSHFVNNDNHTIDEAYIKALSIFNEWRNKQRFASFRKNPKKSKRCPLDETKNSFYMNKTTSTTTTEIQNAIIPNKENVASLSETEDIEVADLKNIYEEIEYVYNHSSKSNDDDQSRKLNTTISSILYENEIHNFEKNYCSQGVQTTNNMNKKDEQIISSPPVRFYKENSIPFKETKSPENYVDKYSVIYSSPKKPSNREVNATAKIEVKPPIRKRRNRSKTTAVHNLNKNCQNYSDHTEIQNKKSHTKNISLPSNCVQVHQSHSRSLGYRQQQQKSNDDFIEYAQITDQNETYMNNIQRNEQNEFQEYVDNNFKFLENNSMMTAFNEDEERASLIDDGISYPPLQKDVIVTDLDQSEEINNPNDAKLNDEIMAELKSLELWSQSLNLIPINNSPRNSLTPKKKQLNLSGTYFCVMDDLKPKTSSFRNSLKCPFVYRSGTFRKTSVSLITSFDENQKENQTKFALQRNYLILRKLRHPNVALLMAICVNKSNDIISLITESFEYTLHDVLHKIRIELPLNDCIDYITQIINALQYMHECKMIHSNISSHAILITNNEKSKTVKLSSFEMTTNLDYHDIKNKLTKYENGSYVRFDQTKFSKDYLPYLIEYRKQYSQYQYQAPELIATRHQFVYPTIKSDIFGVTLLLWEMLNNRVPYELLNYADLEKLYNVKHTKLSSIKVDRCALFNKVIEQGLRIKPSERFEDIILIKTHLEEIKNNEILRENQKNSPKINECDSLLEFSKILKARNFDTDLYDRTSTLKKRKEQALKNNRLSAKELFQDPNNYKDGKYENICDPKVSKDKEQSPQSDENTSRNFDSGIAGNGIDTAHKKQFVDTYQKDYHIPDTPIARNNKLLKVAWLNQSNHQSFSNSKTVNDDDNKSIRITEKIFKYDVTEEDSLKNKRLNVSIRITHGIPKEKSFIDEQSQTENLMADISPLSENEKKDITDQIKYWNSLTSPLNQELLCKEPNTLENYQKVISKKNVTLENQIHYKKQNEQSKKNSSEIFNQNFEEFFSRSRINDVNFESTLWRREKEKCEQQNSARSFYDNDSDEAGVITPRRTSVKETVHKFENYFKCLCQPTILDFHDETREAEKELTFDGNVARMIESEEIRNISEASTNMINTISIELNEDQENEENQKENNDLGNVSKLDVVLRNRNEKQGEKSLPGKQDAKEKLSFIAEINNKSNDEETIKKTISLSAISTFTNQQHPLLLALNLKKLCRRASDVGCPRNITTLTPLRKKNENVRHSICGTEEIFKRLGEIPFVSIDRLQTVDKNSLGVITSDGKNEEQQQFNNNSLSVGKLKCWNCGCQVFSINEIKDNSTSENYKNVEILLPPRQSFGTASQNAKSVEDLYIDDDFNNEVGELCANIELGTEDDDIEQIRKFSDIQLDFDVLSAEILSKLNSSS